MREEMTAFERQLATEIQDLMGPVFPVDDRAVFDAVVAASQPRRSPVFAALRYAAAGVVVTLLAGSLLLGILTTQQRDDTRPAASPSPLVTRFTDPVGDVQRSIGVPVGTPRPDGPDIVAVTMSATAEEVVLEVELVEDWALAVSTLSAFLYPNPIATYQRDGPLPPTHYCSGDLGPFLQIEATERVQPAESASSTETPSPSPLPGRVADPPSPSSLEWPSGAWVAVTSDVAFTDLVEEPLPYEVDGRSLRITIPLAYLGDPETLSLGQVRVVGLDYHASEGDYFPNEQDTCVPVPLPGERPPSADHS